MKKRRRDRRDKEMKEGERWNDERLEERLKG